MENDLTWLFAVAGALALVALSLSVVVIAGLWGVNRRRSRSATEWRSAHDTLKRRFDDLVALKAGAHTFRSSAGQAVEIDQASTVMVMVPTERPASDYDFDERANSAGGGGGGSSGGMAARAEAMTPDDTALYRSLRAARHGGYPDAPTLEMDHVAIVDGPDGPTIAPGYRDGA